MLAVHVAFDIGNKRTILSVRNDEGYSSILRCIIVYGNVCPPSNVHVHFYKVSVKMIDSSSTTYVTMSA